MAKRKAEWQNNYIAKAYDRINLTVPKGKKEVIQSAAQQSGESVNGFIWRLIQSELDRLGAENGESASHGRLDDRQGLEQTDGNSKARVGYGISEPGDYE